MPRTKKCGWFAGCGKCCWNIGSNGSVKGKDCEIQGSSGGNAGNGGNSGRPGSPGSVKIRSSDEFSSQLFLQN